MTNGFLGELAPNTAKVARLLSEKMPHLEFAIWDLSDFLPAFHNVRRTMIFVECEELAREEALRAFAELKGMPGEYLVYTGERKPKVINETWASAKSTDEIRDVIIVIARKDFLETRKVDAKSNIHIPTIERRMVDLIVYAVRGWLPINVKEVVDALKWNLKKGNLKIASLQRYASRRYMGWFVDTTLYTLSKNKEIDAKNIDPRYLELGERYLTAIKEVEEQ